MPRIEKRGESYRLIAYLGYDANNKQIKKTKTIPAEGITKTDAKRLASEFENNCLKNSFIDDKNLTLSGFIDFWKSEYALIDNNYSPKSLERNEQLLKRIIPALGKVRLKKLKPTHLLQFYKNLREPGMRLDKDKEGALSPRTIQMHHKLLSSILGKAKKWQFIELNPCQYVDAPKSKSKKTPIWDEETLIRFLMLLYQHAKTKYLLFFLLAFSTGLRRGELLALRRQDINLDKAEVRVTQSSSVVKGKGIVYKEPKTEKSANAVSFSSSIIPIFHQYYAEQEILRQHSKENGKEWPDNDLLFTTAEGKAMFPTTVSHWLSDFIERYNLPKISPRSFRNMSITYAIDRGFDLKAVSERARHAQLSTTTDVYAHVLAPKDKAIAAGLDQIIQKAKKEEEPVWYGDYI